MGCAVTTVVGWAAVALRPLFVGSRIPLEFDEKPGRLKLIWGHISVKGIERDSPIRGSVIQMHLAKVWLVPHTGIISGGESSSKSSDLRTDYSSSGNFRNQNFHFHRMVLSR